MTSSELKREADLLLAAIGETRREVAAFKAEADKELAQVKSRHKARIDAGRASLARMEKTLERLSRTHKRTLFVDGDRCQLAHGSLVHAVGEAVRRARGVGVELLKELDYLDAVAVTERVDWDVIDTWPDEKLAAIGTERKVKETFSYELEPAADMAKDAA